MSVASLVHARAEADPVGRAIADASGSLLNRELVDRVGAAVEHLQDLGLKPGDVLALRLRNRLEFVVLLYAAWSLGAAVTPINPGLTAGEVERQILDSGAQLLVSGDGSPSVPVVTLGVEELRTAARNRPLAPTPTDPAALALVVYTSGTTGAPKGVMLDHANVDAMAGMCLRGLELTPADRCLLVLPLFHVNGIVVSVLAPLLAGASVVMVERFDPATFLATVRDERISYFSAVPTIFGVLEALPANAEFDTSSVRFAVSGAAPAPGDLLARFETRYGVVILEGYGLSEGTCATTINPISGQRRAGTVGRVMDGQELRISAPDGTDVQAGDEGEVLVRGANVMRGYLGRPDATADVLVDGWLHTGDLGSLDGDGYLTLTGRAKDLIIRGGENISPKEIEDVIAGDPGVQEVAVVGVPDEHWGEIVVAVVQPRSGFSIDVSSLEARCAHQLAPYKRPTKYTVLREMPMTPVGKIDKKALRSEGGGSV
nr:AMP-binding protein [Rhodococcus sp. (in: high G+C Gram-positive bacteria)]